MSEWISVKDKVPDDGVAVLAYWVFAPSSSCMDSPYDVVWLHGGTWWQADDSDQDYGAPDFWQPLPEPPK